MEEVKIELLCGHNKIIRFCHICNDPIKDAIEAWLKSKL